MRTVVALWLPTERNQRLANDRARHPAGHEREWARRPANAPPAAAPPPPANAGVRPPQAPAPARAAPGRVAPAPHVGLVRRRARAVVNPAASPAAAKVLARAVDLAATVPDAWHSTIARQRVRIFARLLVLVGAAMARTDLQSRGKTAPTGNPESSLPEAAEIRG